MKNKFLIVLLCVLSVCSILLGMAACQPNTCTDGHSWDNGMVTTAPTCTEDGVKTFVCNKCGQVKTESVPASHTLTAVSQKDPTSTEDGHEAYWQCSVCHKYFSDEQGKTEIDQPVVIPATGGQGQPTPKHECKHVCSTCGKCTDASCQDPACTDKCLGHETVEGPAAGNYLWVCTQTDGTKWYATGVINGNFMNATKNESDAAVFTIEVNDGTYTIKCGGQIFEAYKNVSGDKSYANMRLVDVSGENVLEWIWDNELGIFKVDLSGEGGYYYFGMYMSSGSLKREAIGANYIDYASQESNFPAKFEKTDKQPGGDVETHVCKHVCPTCSKCTDASCQDPACTDKCLGHETVEGPAAGNYLWVMKDEAKNRTWYALGTMNFADNYTNYLDITTSESEAAVYTLEIDNGVYFIKVNGKYLEAYDSGSKDKYNEAYCYLRLSDTKSSDALTWTWDSENGIFIVSIGEVQYFAGVNYSTDNPDELYRDAIGMSKTRFLTSNFAAKFEKTDKQPGGDVETHVCKHVCPTCSKCTDASCKDPACTDKCLGHSGEENPDFETDFPTTDFEALTEKANAGDQGKYYVVGKVKSCEADYNTTVILEDAEGSTFQIYGVFSSDGSNRLQDATALGFDVGDVVVFYGGLTVYSGTAQMQNGWVVQVGQTAKTNQAEVYVNDLVVPELVSGDFDLPGEGVTWTVKTGTGIVVNENKAVVTPSETQDLIVELQASVTIAGHTATRIFSVKISQKAPDGQKIFILTVDSLNLPSAYKSDQIVVTISGVKFTSAGAANYGNGIQMRTNSKTGTSTIYNDEALGSKILNVEISWNSKQSGNKTTASLLKIDFGTDNNFSGESTTNVNYESGKTAVITPNGSYSFVRFTHNNKGGVYIDSIKITVATDSQSGEDNPIPQHTCQSVCPTCGKCTNASCQDPACVDKCQGNHVTQPGEETLTKPAGTPALTIDSDSFEILDSSSTGYKQYAGVQNIDGHSVTIAAVMPSTDIKGTVQMQKKNAVITLDGKISAIWLEFYANDTQTLQSNKFTVTVGETDIDVSAIAVEEETSDQSGYKMWKVLITLDMTQSQTVSIKLGNFAACYATEICFYGEVA